jgi:hypothetical protein
MCCHMKFRDWFPSGKPQGCCHVTQLSTSPVKESRDLHITCGHCRGYAQNACEATIAVMRPHEATIAVRSPCEATNAVIIDMKLRWKETERRRASPLSKAELLIPLITEEGYHLLSIPGRLVQVASECRPQGSLCTCFLGRLMQWGSAHSLFIKQLSEGTAVIALLQNYKPLNCHS